MKILLQPKCNLPTFKALRFIKNLIRSKVKYISIMSCQLSNTPSIPQQFSITALNLELLFCGTYIIEFSFYVRIIVVFLLPHGKYQTYLSLQ